LEGEKYNELQNIYNKLKQERINCNESTNNTSVTESNEYKILYQQEVDKNDFLFKEINNYEQQKLEYISQ